MYVLRCTRAVFVLFLFLRSLSLSLAYCISHIFSLHAGTQNMSYKDGTTPPKEVLKTWLDLCFNKFQKEKSKGSIAIHCVAGLGRAPLLVAIALIESGRDYTDAVQLIRKKRSGCINRAQLEYLRNYKPTMAKSCCVIA